MLGDIILNLGLHQKADYRTGVSFGYAVSTHDESLATELYNRLVTIGLKSSLPVIVEFYTDMTSYSTDWKDHLFGFCRVILNLQGHYSGKIVLAIPPSTPGTHASQSSYVKFKRQRSQLSKCALTIGLACGVPVWVPHIQTFMTEEQPYFFRSSEWQKEYLFGPTGNICNEYVRRLGTEFTHMIHKLNSYTVPTHF